MVIRGIGYRAFIVSNDFSLQLINSLSSLIEASDFIFQRTFINVTEEEENLEEIYFY